MPKISVIVPVYNTAPYLEECLNSILAQSFDDFEAICINDGSTDDSAKILKDYALKDSRIHVINQKNAGLSAARNAGLNKATGDWICFVDSDDLLPGNALTVLYGIAQSAHCKIVASREKFKCSEYKLKKCNKSSMEYSFSYQEWMGLQDFVRDPKIYSSVWNKLYASELFKKQRFKEGMVFEDWPVLTILVGQTDRYVTTDIPCYVYRQDNTSVTRSSFSQKKLESYITGVRMVYGAYKHSSQLPLARKRMAVAIKMLVSKIYHAKNAALTTMLIHEMKALYFDKVLAPSDLSLKTRFRLWLLQFKNC